MNARDATEELSLITSIARLANKLEDSLLTVRVNARRYVETAI